MRIITTLLAATLLLSFFTNSAVSNEKSGATLLVKFKSKDFAQYLYSREKNKEYTLSVSENEVVRNLKSFGVLSSVAKLSTLNALNQWISVQIKDKDIVRLSAQLQKNSEILVVEKLPDYQMFATPNDLNPKQWALKKINAENAWDVVKGNPGIRVAIVDDAVDLTHPDLKPAIWKNPNEIEGNGIDDDKNGYIDDVYGWDAAENDNDPNPPSSANTSHFSHGTHCAGIAAAATDNTIGMASIGYGVSIIPVKSKLDATSGKSLTHVFQGVEYAVACRADVISMSWGGGGFSVAYQELFNEAHRLGIILVAAAGNDNTDIPMFPASYNHVIAVAASNVLDKKAWFSNYGSWVDVTAPGEDIYSTVPGSEEYASFSGTSMACPLVAGLVGLMKSRLPLAEPEDIELCLKSTCDNIDTLNTKYTGTLGAGRVNAFTSILCIKPGPPRVFFDSDLRRNCVNAPISFSDRSKGTSATSWTWNFPGAIPPTSHEQNPKVRYTSNGVFDVTLIACNEYGCDTIIEKAYITIAPPKATLIMSTRDSICDKSHTFLQLSLEGNPPWTVTWSDGFTTFTESNILNKDHFISITPSDSNIYSLLSVKDRLCDGSIQSGKKKFTLINCGGTPGRNNAIWYFGDFAGIDFNHEPPVPLLNSAMTTSEGCATVCDENGNLMFYSDGVTVWNKNHKPMPNGTNLKGNTSSTQSAIVVPDPGNRFQFYLFTVSAEEVDQYGLYYSIIDTRLNGGLGDVTTVKNVFLMKEASEKLTATRHDNNKDVWIASFERYTNTYYTFLLSDKGIGKPIKTSTGKILKQANIHGHLRFSHDGTLLVMGYAYDNTVQICRFDKKTGKPSWWFNIEGDDMFAYGLEFSPDDSKLYIGNHSKATVYQVDMKAGSASEIKASMRRMATTSRYADALQVGPDGKIYMALNDYEYLGVIPNPNDKDAKFIHNGFYLGGKKSKKGLPNFMTGFRVSSQELTASNDTVVCLGKAAKLSAVFKEATKASYFWNPTDGLDDPYSRTPIATPLKNTKYIVTAIDRFGMRFYDSVTVYVDPNCCKSFPPKADFEISNTLCLGDSLVIVNKSVTTSAAKFLWTFGNNILSDTSKEKNPSKIAFNRSGLFTIALFIDDSCGTDSLQKQIAVYTPPPSRGKFDTLFCSSESAFIEGRYISGYSYVWNPEAGLSDSRIPNPRVIQPPGIYVYTRTMVNDATGCSVQDTITVKITDVPLAVTFDTIVCSVDSVVIGIPAQKGMGYLWTPKNGVKDPTQARTTLTLPKGRYVYTLTVTDSLSGCAITDKFTILFDSKPDIHVSSKDTVICKGVSIPLLAEGGITYKWTPSVGLNRDDIPNPIASPEKTQRYTVQVTGENGCSDTASVLINVLPFSKTQVVLEPIKDIVPGDTAYIILTFDVPEGLSTEHGITTFSFDINFDNSALFPIIGQFEQTGALANWVLKSSYISLGTMRITGIGGPLNSDSKLTIKAIALLPNKPVTDTFDLYISAWDASPNNVCTGISGAIGGGITYSSICAAGLRPIKTNGIPFGITGITPNPSDKDNAIVIHYQAGLEAYTEMSLYNSFGELILIPIHQTLTPGYYTYTVKTESLPSGLYIVRIKNGPYTVDKTFIIK